MKLFSHNTLQENKRYLVVSGAPLLDAFFASAFIPASMVLLTLGPPWVANLLITFIFPWLFFRGQTSFTQAEKNENLQAERVFFFWLPAWALLFALGAWNLVATPVYIILAVAITAIGTYLAHRYLPWVITRQRQESELNTESDTKRKEAL